MIIISDIHGCFKTLQALIKQLPKDKIVFAGDLIDRGPDSKGVIQYAIDNSIECIRGNHEQMLIDRDLYVWRANGGDKMQKNYGKSWFEFLAKAKEHLMWTDTLPYVLEFPKTKREDGRHLVVTHAALLGTIAEKDGTEGLLWNRREAKDNPGIFNVFGHTPQKDVIIKDHFALIDTGCPYGYKLSALQFPSMKIWTQENIENES